ncbi:MAG: hypothetical protein FGM55_07610 [Rhodoferax sp.]|nr:hypothetical protein [Rhodoferax sp.]
MKFQPDFTGVQTISAYGPGWVGLGSERIHHPVILTSQGLRQPWNCPRFEDLTAEHFSPLAELDVELVLFGSGDRLRFPLPAWLAPIMRRRIGLETMDTPAACRTFNILAGEGRRVAAALLLPGL